VRRFRTSTLKKPCNICVFLLILFLVSCLPRVVCAETAKKRRLVVTGTTYFPAELEKRVGAAFERMLYTRLFPYFDIIEGEPVEKEPWDYILNLSLTQIGEGVSIDILVTDEKGKKTRKYFTGEDIGQIPDLLEGLADSIKHVAYGKMGPKRLKPIKDKETELSREPAKSLPPKFAASLPRGKLRYSPSHGGGYFMFSGGDLNRDGKDEIVAVREKGIAVLRIEDETVSNLFTYDLKKDEKVIYLACGDVNRDQRSEVVATIVGSYGVRGLVLFYEPEEKHFSPVDFPDAFLRIFNDREKGSVLLAQGITNKGGSAEEVEFIKLEGNQREKLWSMPVETGVSLENSTPVWFDGSYAILEYGGGSIQIRGAKNATYYVDEFVEDVRTIDLNGDGNQEILVLLSRVQKSGYFESLPVKRGFAVELFGVNEGGLFKDYRFENETLKVGGFFPRFSAKGAIEEFVVIALQGNDFFPSSIKWKEIKIR